MIWPGVQLVSFIATAYVRTISCYLLTPIIFMLALQKLQQIFPQKKTPTNIINIIVYSKNLVKPGIFNLV